MSVAIVAIVALVVVSGAFAYMVTRPESSGLHVTTLYAGVVTSDAPVVSTDCAPYSLVLATCNATQVSVVFHINATSSDMFGPNTLFVSVNVTNGPRCVVTIGLPMLVDCRYILEFQSPFGPLGSGPQPPLVNATIYLVNETQTWELPASLYDSQVTLRYINGEPVTPFTASIRIQQVMG